MSYSPPQRWAAQQAFHRQPSRSPNTKDRTPIRHTRPVVSRDRSTSRSQALLAYAKQHVHQVQPASRPSIDFSASDPQGQPFPFTSITTPYMHQQAYLDPTNSSAGFGQLQQQQSLYNLTNIYNANRGDMQLSNTAEPMLNLNDTLYSQSRTTQLPSMSSTQLGFPTAQPALESTSHESDMMGNRQKPQCWEHGCNGRQFSTFSNLLRHQREKSGTATKARCPHCGTEFTRTTARNGHLYGGKCKGLPEPSRDGDGQTPEEMDPKS